MIAKEAPQTGAAIANLEEPLYRARSATKALEMILDAILESRHPLPSQPGSVELILGAEEVEAAQYAMADAKSRIREVCEAWEVLFHQERATVSPVLARVASLSK